MSLDAVLPTNLPTVFDDNGDPVAAFADRALNVYDPYVTYTAVNVKTVPCLDIRKAIYYARDYAGLIQLSGGAAFGGDPADGSIKPLMGLDYAKVTGLDEFMPAGNADAAKKYMAAAKTACPDVHARAIDPNRGLTFDAADSDTNKKSAAIWIDSLKKNAGITLKFNFIEPGSYYAVVLDQTKQGDMSRAGWAPDWANASTVIPELFASFGGFNLSQNSDDPNYKKFEDKVNLAMKTTDRKKQAAMWKQLDAEAMKNFWVLPTTFGKAQEVWGSQLANVFFWVPQGNPAYGKIWINN